MSRHTEVVTEQLVENIEAPPADTLLTDFLANVLVELQSDDVTHLDVEVYSETFKETATLRITLINKPRSN